MFTNNGEMLCKGTEERATMATATAEADEIVIGVADATHEDVERYTKKWVMGFFAKAKMRSNGATIVKKACQLLKWRTWWDGQTAEKLYPQSTLGNCRAVSGQKCPLMDNRWPGQRGGSGGERELPEGQRQLLLFSWYDGLLGPSCGRDQGGEGQTPRLCAPEASRKLAGRPP